MVGVLRVLRGGSGRHGRPPVSRSSADVRTLMALLTLKASSWPRSTIAYTVAVLTLSRAATSRTVSTSSTTRAAGTKRGTTGRPRGFVAMEPVEPVEGARAETDSEPLGMWRRGEGVE